jgi:peptidyl-prolyl cis-trans isomerase A (cyclophilin A)
MVNAVIHTGMGDIRVEFFAHASEAVDNFTGLARDGLYDGNQFHYVIKDFIIQGGDLPDSITGGEFPDEYDIDYMFNRPWLVATAGSGDMSHGSQFFIILREADHLNWNHTIFGEVTDEQSRQVVAEINAVKTDSEKCPLQPVVITSITIEE